MSFKNIVLVDPNGRVGLGFASDLIPTGLEYVTSSIENVANKRLFTYG